MRFWYVRVKIFVSVFAISAAYTPPIVEQKAVNALYWCPIRQIELSSIYALSLESFVCYVSHTQKPGATPREA